MRKTCKAAALFLAVLVTVGGVSVQAAAPRHLVQDGQPTVTPASRESAGSAEKSGAYVSLGADLTADQRAEVLRLLGLSEASLAGMSVVTVTNDEEHQYLDAYVDASVIGTHALSSCKILPRDTGSGISVETHNITYVTPAMYENALATAGMKDAEVVVAGPFSLSGTAALIGAMKAYEVQTGNVISPQLLDGATDELVTTGLVAESLGDPEKAAQLIAAVKQVMAENEITSKAELGDAIDSVSSQMGISLSEKDRQLVLDLLEKLSTLDLDVDNLTEQARGIYEEIRGLGLNLEQYGITKDRVNSLFDAASELFVKFIAWLKAIF